MEKNKIGPLTFLDLFAGTQSFKEALSKKFSIDFWHYDNGIWKGYARQYNLDKDIEDYEIKVEYVGVDIFSPVFKNLIVDLSLKNSLKKLLKALPKKWKPDFIWASPVCTTFSKATCIKNGTLSFVLETIGKKRIRLREKNEFWYITHNNYKNFTSNKKWIKEQQVKGKLSLKMIENTRKIIDYYKPRNFVIENPATALSRYLFDDLERNIGHYCMYGFNYKKPTAFYSNVKLKLDTCNHSGPHLESMSGAGGRKGPTGNTQRSKVPPSLIKEIINQTLFW